MAASSKRSRRRADACALLVACVAACRVEQPPGDARATATSSTERAVTGEGESAAADECTDEPACDAPETAHPKLASPGIELGLARGVGDAGDAWLERGERRLSERRWEEARRAFERARAELPQHPAPVVGEVLAEFGAMAIAVDYAEAPQDQRVLALVERLKRAPGTQDYAPLHLVRGRLLLVAGDASLAKRALERALQLRPLHAEAHSSLGVAHLALGEVEHAVRHLERAVALDATSAARATNLGAALMMAEQPERAREVYARAVELDPDDARTRSDLGTALLALGQPRAALIELEHALRLDSTRAPVMSNLGYAFLLLGELGDAERWLRAAIDTDASLGSAWINLGVVLAKQRRFDAAEAALQRALELDPEDPRALDNLRELNDERKPRP